MFDRTENDEEIDDVLDEINFQKRDDEEESGQRIFFDEQYLDEIERAKAYKVKMGAKRHKKDAEEGEDFLRKYDEVSQLKNKNQGEYCHFRNLIQVKFSL